MDVYGITSICFSLHYVYKVCFQNKNILDYKKQPRNFLFFVEKKKGWSHFTYLYSVFQFYMKKRESALSAEQLHSFTKSEQEKIKIEITSKIEFGSSQSISIQILLFVFALNRIFKKILRHLPSHHRRSCRVWMCGFPNHARDYVCWWCPNWLPILNVSSLLHLEVCISYCEPERKTKHAIFIKN